MKHLLTLLIVLLIPTAALAKGECRDERKKFCAGMVKSSPSTDTQPQPSYPDGKTH
jgi:hypothetical protein